MNNMYLYKQSIVSSEFNTGTTQEVVWVGTTGMIHLKLGKVHQMTHFSYCNIPKISPSKII